MDIPNTIPELITQFSIFLNLASSRAKDHKIIIVLDALNQLDQTDTDTNLLHWLPMELPQNVHIITSTTKGSILDTLQNRKCTIIEAKELSEQDRAKCIRDFIWTYGKKLSDENVFKIIHNEQTKNILFLRVLLQELCVVGFYKAFDQQLNYYLAAKNLPELFEQLLNRWEIDYGKELLQ